MQISLIDISKHWVNLLEQNRNLHRVYIMSKEEFIKNFNNASDEVKSLVLELLTDCQQHSESLE